MASDYIPWVARDKDGALWLFSYKPVRGESIFRASRPGDHYFRIPSTNCQEVTWTNSPRRVTKLVIETSLSKAAKKTKKDPAAKEKEAKEKPEAEKPKKKVVYRPNRRKQKK